jgi:hypothetical protein
MVCLAERQVRSTSALTLGAAFALTLVASLRTGNAPAALPPASVEPAPHEAAMPQATGEDCPATVRAQLHLASPHNVVCIAGNYSAPGYFVHATYDTTETWERFAIVARDGRMILPLTDRPLLRPMSFFAADLDGDGRDEIVGSLSGCDKVLIDIMSIRGDVLAVTSQSIPLHRGAPGCALGDIAFVGHDLWIDDAIYRLDRGWLVFAGSTHTR